LWLIILVYIQLVGYAVNMHRLIIIFISVLLSISVAAETVFKKTNPKGVVEFSDQPSKDSEEIKVRKPITFPAPRLPSSTLSNKKLSPIFNYSLTIVKPTKNIVLVNKQDVLVSVVIKPTLEIRYGHKIRYQLAGVSILSSELSTTFKNIERGMHILNVSIVDKNNKVISPVASISLHMKRFFKKPSVKKPKTKTP
jgi:hypothetical protein